MNIAIGIDLGTTYSCVGIFRKDHVEIVPNDAGSYATPSIVSYADTGLLVGENA